MDVNSNGVKVFFWDEEVRGFCMKFCKYFDMISIVILDEEEFVWMGGVCIIIIIMKVLMIKIKF